jgi:hypothetical protein
MTNIDINKIKLITFIFIPSFIVSVICPGILFVFIFNENLFIDTEIIKLTLLCISISFPIWFINSIFTYHKIYYNSDVLLKNDDLQFASILGSFITIPILYIPILIKIFYNISLQVGIIISILLQIIIILIINYEKIFKYVKSNS